MASSLPHFSDDIPSDVDTETHATDWASGFAKLEREKGAINNAAAPPLPAPPGHAASVLPSDAVEPASVEGSDEPNADHGGEPADDALTEIIFSEEIDDYDPDTATGASPGVSSACRDLGLSSLESVTRKLNIKPPGQC